MYVSVKQVSFWLLSISKVHECWNDPSYMYISQSVDIILLPNSSHTFNHSILGHSGCIKSIVLLHFLLQTRYQRDNPCFFILFFPSKWSGKMSDRWLNHRSPPFWFSGDRESSAWRRYCTTPTPWFRPGLSRGVLTYLAKRGCAALMGRFFTRNP